MLPRYTRPEMHQLWVRPETKFEHWLLVEGAALEAREHLGDAPTGTHKAVLSHASISVKRMDEIEKEVDHDVIAFVKMVQESLEAAGVGQYKEEFHKRLTSFDVVDPALIMMLREACYLIRRELVRLRETLLRRATEHKWTLMMAWTHVQDAEPSSFGHLLLVYSRAVMRSINRLDFVVSNDLSEGRIKGAVGIYGQLNPAIERRALQMLGLKPAVAETQILQRDRHAALVSVLSIAAATIAQMALTFQSMCSSRRRELREPRKPKQRGSSAMGHKRNPIKFEQLKGLARNLRGLAVTETENIETPDYRDIAESASERHVLPDATSLVHYMAYTMADLVDKMEVFPERMVEILNEESLGVWAGQEIRNALMEGGVDYDTAYEYIQKVCFEAVDTRVHLRDLLGSRPMSESDSRTARDIIDAARLSQCFDAAWYIADGVEAVFKMECYS